MKRTTLLAILAALSVSVGQAAQVFAPGILKYEYFPGQTRQTVEAGTAGSPAFNAAGTVGSDTSGYATIFESGVGFADNYANRFSGFFVPPTTGDYVFFVAGDDDCDLFLSTDDNPANKKLIAQEAGWSNAKSWTAIGGGSTPEQKRSDSFSPDNGATKPGAAGYHLVAGNHYYIEGVHHEGGGGDNFSATFKLKADADPADGDDTKLTGNVLGALVDSDVVLLPQPQPTNRRVAPGDTPTFAVATFTQDAKFQWYKSGTAIAGATSSSYQLPAVTAGDNGATFYVVVSNKVNSVQSSNAVITVGKLVLVAGAKDEVWDAATRDDVESGSLDSTTPFYLNAMSSFEAPNNQTKDGADFPFAQRLSAIFLPPVTGDYVFFIAADDDSDLFISTDATPAKKYQIAAEPGWSGIRNYTIINGGSPLSQKRSDSWVPDPTSPPAAPPYASGIHLIAGNKYYIEGVEHEGGGGDNLTATYKLVGDPDPANGSATLLSGFVLDKYVNALDGALITITNQPQNATATQSRTATFTIGASSSYIGDATGLSPGLAYQWQTAPAGSSTFANIPGASGTSYTTPILKLTDNGAQYRVALLAGDTNATSSVATLTVTADTTPPTISSVSAVPTAVSVVFNELLDQASAAVAGNYSIDQGVTVSAATVFSGATQDSVKLTITGATAGTGYTLTVNGVKDRAGNAIAADTKATFTPSTAKAFFDFDSGLPLTTEIQGSATVEATGGLNGTGGLQLTPPAGGQQGGFFIPDLDGGKPVFGIQVDFKLLITDPSGNPADGVSFSWGSDVTSTAVGEEGAGTGLIVEFDTFDNGGTDNYGIDVKWNGTEIGTTVLPKDTANSGFILVNKEWTDVSIGVYGTGDVYVTHHGTNYYNKLNIPDFAAISGGNFLFGGRTGGELTRQVIDNLAINTFLAVTPAPTNAPPPTTGAKLTATKSGTNLTISWTPTGGKLQSTPALAGAATVWTDVGTANPATVPIAGSALYLRVVSP